MSLIVRTPHYSGNSEPTSIQIERVPQHNSQYLTTLMNRCRRFLRLSKALIGFEMMERGRSVLPNGTGGYCPQPTDTTRDNVPPFFI